MTEEMHVEPRDATYAQVHGSRRSVRAFTGEVVSRELVRAIVEEATAAPSAFNSQPWRVVVVRGTELDRVLPAMGGNAETVAAAGSLVAILADTDLQGRSKSFYDGGLARTPVEYGVRNASLLAMAIMDGAWSHGVGTCPMIGFDPVALTQALDVPASWHPVLTMPLGWPADTEHAPRQRVDVDDILQIVG